jgi:hypothetical protein
MLRLFITISLFFLGFSAAAMDIESACKERDEQKKALLSNMSTSLSEALLVGQCTGYHKTSYTKYRVSSFEDLPQACLEFVEQKEALLPFDMSTTLSEAMLAGMCLGAIYKIAEDCNRNEHKINYVHIAKDIKGTTENQAVLRIAKHFKCR